MPSYKMNEQPHPLGEGIARTYTFTNGTVLSAVKFPGSYGYKDGLWEIAALDSDGNFITQACWHDVYDDVIGWVKESNLESYVDDIYYWDLEVE